MRLALALLLLLGQDAVERLGDPDPAVRDGAARELRKTRPLEALRRAKNHPDPEVRGRAAALVAQIELEIAQEEREKEQRPKAMNRLAADQKPGPGLAITDGARFTVTRRAWPAGGTVFETRAERFLDGDLEWDVAGVNGAPVERCTLHSPGRVYLPGPAPEAPELTVKGVRRWRCETPIEFKEPRPGVSWRSGPVEVAVVWPTIVVRMDAPVPEAFLTGTLDGSDVKVRLRAPANSLGVIGGGGGGGGRYGGRLGGKKTDVLAWCGCVGKPSEEKREPTKTAREHVVRLPAYEDEPLEKVASITIAFRKPIEEPFEIVSSPVE